MTPKLDELLETITTSIMGGTNGDYGNKAPDPNEDFYNRGDSRYHTNTKRKKKKKIMKESEEDILEESKFELTSILPITKGKIFYEKRLKLTENLEKNKFRFKVLLNDLVNSIKTLIEIKQSGKYKFDYNFTDFVNKHDYLFEEKGGTVLIGAALSKGVFRLVSAKDGKLIR